MKRSPDLSERRHWWLDPVTVWVLDRLSEQFRPWPRSRGILNPDELAKFNSKAGSQEVLEAIEKLMGDENSNPTS